MRNIRFEDAAFDDFSNWALYDKQVFKKIIELIKHSVRQPFEGLGKPEPLKFDKRGYWSRRINAEHRLVYKIDENGDIHIASCKGHY
ncbi:MAG: Txe/YoeB family addiction module toxin [Bacteroidales bacterium]|nr:Txe/YoeB family addiction module toxin [Bacteroidales bacterium]